jgi:hypothetical protein
MERATFGKNIHGAKFSVYIANWDLRALIEGRVGPCTDQELLAAALEHTKDKASGDIYFMTPEYFSFDPRFVGEAEDVPDSGGRRGSSDWPDYSDDECHCPHNMGEQPPPDCPPDIPWKTGPVAPLDPTTIVSLDISLYGLEPVLLICDARNACFVRQRDSACLYITMADLLE